MAGQICRTCKHKNDWCYCSPNSCCTDYEYDGLNDFVEYVKNEFDCDITIKKDKKPDTFESIFGESFSDSMENSMIRASRKAGLTRNELLDTLFEKGVLAIYNLGMKHMYEYLER
jgi:hypothetical protein